MFRDIWNWVFNKRARRFYCHRILKRFGVLLYMDYAASIWWLYAQAKMNDDFLDTMERFIYAARLEKEMMEKS